MGLNSDLSINDLERRKFREGANETDSRVQVDINEFNGDEFPNLTPSVRIPALTDMTYRLQTVETNRLFESTWQYSKVPQFWSERLTGGATITTPGQKDRTYLLFETTAADGDEALFSSKRFIKYQPFRTHIVTFAAVFQAGATNSVKRIGQFTNFNGWFFEQSDGLYYIVVRNNVDQPTGTVETRVERSNWNIDKLDGTGQSGINLNLDNVVTYIIEFVWHGAQGLKFGIQYFDQIYWVHFINHTGVSEIPFTRTALLPLRAQLINNGAVTGGGSMYLGPVSFNVEGGQEERGYTYAASGETTSRTLSSTTWTVLFALRPKATFNGSNNRGYLIPERYTIFPNSEVAYQVLVDGTTVGGTWIDNGADSIAEYNLTVTDEGTGRVVKSSYGASATKTSDGVTDDFERDIFSSLDAINSNQPLEIIVRAKRLGSSSISYASMQWREVY